MSISLFMFTSEGCRPCTAMKPVAIAVADELGIAISVKTVDKDSEETKEHDIRGVPTFVVKKDNKVVFKKTGLMSKAELRNALQQN